MGEREGESEGESEGEGEGEGGGWDEGTVKVGVCGECKD